MSFRRFVNDPACAMRSDQCPDEESDTSSGCDDGLDGEQMANLVNREPDEGKRASPEEDEGDEVVDSAAKRDSLGQRWSCSERGPDSEDHEVNTLATNPSLYAIPNTVALSDILLPIYMGHATHHAINARFKTGHNEPKIPNEALFMTGKEMWYTAPTRPVKQMKNAEIL